MFKAWTANAAGAKLAETTINLPELAPDQVEVRIEACGICASDVDAIKGVYGNLYRYPMVPGHEGAGVVTRVGALANSLRVGDRVGLGVYRSTCSTCSYCCEGHDNLCSTKEMMFAQNYGCFSEVVRINHRFAFKIPDAISTAEAAPLMCAGVTTYAPFLVHGLGHGDRVGVLGIGGLGHLAIQFAHHHGCETVALSRSDSKEAYCRALGAHHYINLASDTQRKKIAGSLDAILITASGEVDWQELLSYLAPNGKLIIMGVVKNPLNFTAIPLIMGQKSICGSAAGSSNVARTMLNFCAVHSIRPKIEIFPFTEVNKAIQHTAEGKANFRAVLVR